MSPVHQTSSSLPEAVMRLNTIKPGQEMIYYTGNLPEDLKRSKNVPAYYKQLELLKETADTLRRQRRARLEERKGSKTSQKGERIPVTEYVAIGIG